MPNKYLWEIFMQIEMIAPIGARKCNFPDYSNLGKTDQLTDGHKSSLRSYSSKRGVVIVIHKTRPKDANILKV